MDIVSFLPTTSVAIPEQSIGENEESANIDSKLCQASTVNRQPGRVAYTKHAKPDLGHSAFVLRDSLADNDLRQVVLAKLWSCHSPRDDGVAGCVQPD